MATTTFLFVDQVGSTEQLSRLGDAAAQPVRVALFDLLRQSMQVHGGHEVDFTGDGLFCAFGSAFHAVDTAVAMQKAVTSFTDRHPSDCVLSVRIGLNTGEPLESEGGGYFGSAVVVAARLCSHARSGQILASALVRALVEPRGVHRFEPVGRVRLKGIPDPVETFAVGWEPDDRRGQLPEVLQTARVGPFIGRTRELNAVLAAWRRTLNGGRQLFLIGADSGMGATRFAAESAEALRQLGASVWAGTGHGAEARLAAWAEAIGGWASGMSRAELRLAVGDRGGDLLRLVPELADLLPGLPVPQPLEPETAVFVVADAVDAVAARWSAVEPLVIVLDRLHEADPASLAVLRRLMRSRRPGRVMVIGCYEPPSVGVAKVVSTLADVPGVVGLRLEGLAESEVRELISTAAGEPVTEDVVRAVLAESEGSPFYVLQMARSAGQEQISRRVAGAVERAAELRTDLHMQRDEIAFGLRQLDQLRDECSPTDMFRMDPEDAPPAPGVSPYRGLLAFTAADVNVFFGRDPLIAEMVAGLSVSRWLAVVGPSGSGKSSVVRAGLQPALARGALPGSSGWAWADIRPGSDPLQALGVALADLSDRVDATALAAQLRSAPLGPVVRHLIGGRRLVVHVDQFEELWTSSPEAVRTRLLDLLVEAATAAQEPVSVVVTMRADYYGRTVDHPALATLMAESQVLVPPMTPAELRAAIELPARRAGLVLEPGLAQAVVDDVAGEPGGLPLLSTAMQETWERRRGRTLTLTGYAETGGARRAIAHLADATLDALDAGQQETARHLLQRLAAPSAEGSDVARTAPLSELVVDENTRTVLDHLTARRLVTTGETTAQVAHEALLREWPRLRSWLDADREGRRLHQQIAVAAAEWEGSGQDDGSLLRGARLAAAEDWRSQNDDHLTAREQRFLDASVHLREREIRRARRTTRRFQVLAAVLVLLLGGLGAVMLLAVHNSRTASERANQVIVRDLVNEAGALAGSQLDTALLLAVEAYRRDPSAETQSALLTALDAAKYLVAFRPLSGVIRDSVVTPDGRSLWVLTSSGELRSFDTTDWAAAPTTRLRGIPAPTSLDLSPDGRRAVYVAADGVHLVDLAGGPPRSLSRSAKASALFPRHDSRFIVLVEPDPAPRLSLLDAGSGAVVHRFPADMNTTALVRPGHDELVISEAPPSSGPGSEAPQGSVTSIQRFRPDGGPLSPPVEYRSSGVLDWNYTNDGRGLLVTDGTSVSLLDADTLQLLGEPLISDRTHPVSIEVSPADDRAAISYDDGSVGVASWDPQAGVRELLRTAPLPGGWASTSWLDDNRFLAITSSVCAQFDLTEPTPLSTRLGPKTPFPAFTVSKDGRQVFFVAGGHLRQVDTSGSVGPLDVPLPVEARTNRVSVQLSPDGSQAAVLGPAAVQTPRDPQGREDDTLGVIPLRPSGDPRIQTLPATPSGHPLAIALGGKRLAVYDGARIAQFDLGSGRPLGSPVPVGSGVTALQYCADGTALILGDDRGNLRSLDTATGRLGDPHELARDNAITSMDVTLRGDRLLVATSSGDVLSTNPRSLAADSNPLVRTSTPLRQMTVSPDASRLAAIGGNGSLLLLWDFHTRKEIGPPLQADQLRGPPGYLSSGQQLVTAGPSGIMSWDLRPESWRATACRLANRSLTHAEWDTFLPGEPYRKTC